MTHEITADRLAYWYLRLNGFLTIENFILHDETGGSQKTDIDLVALRFPYRREALRENNGDPCWMVDDRRFVGAGKAFAAFVEVTIGPCKINGPWTDRDKGNLPRALRALGALTEEDIPTASDHLYKQGKYETEQLVLGLVSIGRELDRDLTEQLPNAMQITWGDVKRFIFDRFQKFERIKRERPQWSEDGHLLWQLFKVSNGDFDRFRKSVEPVAILHAD